MFQFQQCLRQVLGLPVPWAERCVDDQVQGIQRSVLQAGAQNVLLVLLELAHLGQQPCAELIVVIHDRGHLHTFGPMRAATLAAATALASLRSGRGIAFMVFRRLLREKNLRWGYASVLGHTRLRARHVSPLRREPSTTTAVVGEAIADVVEGKAAVGHAHIRHIA